MVTEREQFEDTNGRYKGAFYEKFAKDVTRIVEDLKAAISKKRADGARVIGYGAAAKGNTLLNFGKISLDYIVDDNPLKQGLLTPGMDIEIKPREALKEEAKPIVVLPLAWNFFDEIYKKVKALRPEASDIFVTYFPHVSERN